MARKKEKIETGYALFDVEYEDGTRSSNRRAPKALLGGSDADEAAKRAIEEQDEAIATRSGVPPRKIKKLTRAKC